MNDHLVTYLDSVDERLFNRFDEEVRSPLDAV